VDAEVALGLVGVLLASAGVLVAWLQLRRTPVAAQRPFGRVVNRQVDHLATRADGASDPAQR
jgi:hypothetical protein